MTYHNHLRALLKLDGDALKRMAQAVCDYSELGIEPVGLGGAEMVLFEIFKESLDRDSEKYQRRIKSTKTAGRKSAESRQKKSKNKSSSKKKEQATTIVDADEQTLTDVDFDERNRTNANEAEPNEPTSISTSSSTSISTSSSLSPVGEHTEKESGERENFIPPTLEMVETYAKGTGLQVDARRFVAVQEENGWKDSEGRPIRNWRTWLEGWAARNPIRGTGAVSGGKGSNFLAYPQRTYEEGELDYIYTDLSPYMEGRKNEQ